MYCKVDLVDEFQGTIKNIITHEEFVDLFIICLKNDSFKIGILIYTLYMNPINDVDEQMIDILIDTMRNSVKFHEIKLFMLHQHFDIMTI